MAATSYVSKQLCVSCQKPAKKPTPALIEDPLWQREPLHLTDGSIVPFISPTCGSKACDRRARSKAIIKIENAKEEALDQMTFCAFCGVSPDSYDERVVCTWCWSYVWCCKRHKSMDSHPCASSRAKLIQTYEETAAWCLIHSHVGLNATYLHREIELLKVSLLRYGKKHIGCDMVVPIKPGQQPVNTYEDIPKGTLKVYGLPTTVTYVLPGSYGENINITRLRDTRITVGITKVHDTISVMVHVGHGSISGVDYSVRPVLITYDLATGKRSAVGEGIDQKSQWFDKHPLSAAIGRQQSIFATRQVNMKEPSRMILKNALHRMQHELRMNGTDAGVASLDRVNATLELLNASWDVTDDKMDAHGLCSAMGLFDVDTDITVESDDAGEHALAFKLLCIILGKN